MYNFTTQSQGKKDSILEYLKNKEENPGRKRKKEEEGGWKILGRAGKFCKKKLS